MCVGQIILSLNSYHYFTLKYGSSQGTNTIDEFYTLWISMREIVEKSVSMMHVLGD
jgi:hypothetical protein